MTIRSIIMNFAQQEELNFILTNRMPRRLATQWLGWFSRIENPLVCAASLRAWRLFTDLDLNEAQETRFRSMHDCFTRRLKPGSRPVDADPATLVSPCDGIVGAAGTIVDGKLLQVKGSDYAMADLLGDDPGPLAGGVYVTLRLTSSMYHRFHAPHDLQVGSVTHIYGDTWNVNPATLKRVDRLFCRNERAVIRTTVSGHPVTLVPVAAILVAGIRLTFLDMDHRTEPRHDYPCSAAFAKGEEMGWFEHGSTIIVLAPAGFTLCAGLADGGRIRAGEPLLRLPEAGG